MEEDLKDIVNSLNNELFNFGFDDGEIEFSYTTNGYVSIVEFLGVTVYNSEVDDRDWDEELDDYEVTIEQSIRYRSNDLLKALKELRFV